MDVVRGTDKPPLDSDTSDSDWDESPPDTRSLRQGVTLAEAKAIDREILWWKIMDMGADYIQAFKESAIKEAKSWESLGSVQPLKTEQANQVMRNKALSKRILRTRSCYRDKNKGQSDLKAKCRVVALGHQAPDIYHLNREWATPNRTSEHMLFAIMTAGANAEFAETGKKWFACTGDAATAFL